MPRFSVLMPTHYRPDVVGYAIESVLMQTETDFELMMVGDGATAETALVVRSFTDSRIRWFDLPKAPGFGYANRNAARYESKGELIAYAADDDLLLPDHLERLGACFSRSEIMWAYSQALWVSSDGVIGPDLTNLHFADERHFFQSANTIAGGAGVFRASAFETRASFPEHVPSGADWHMFKELLSLYGEKGLAVLRQPTFFHFVAGRKKERNSQFGLLQGYIDVADHSSWWPGILHPSVSPTTPIQAQFLDHIRRSGWVAELRSAAVDAANRIALGHLDERLKPNPRESRLWSRRAVQRPSLKIRTRRLRRLLKRWLALILRPTSRGAAPP